MFFIILNLHKTVSCSAGAAERQLYIYCTHAIITRSLYIFYPIFVDHFFVFKEIFKKILSLCMDSIQERFLIKSGLWWRAYGIYKNLLYCRLFCKFNFTFQNTFWHFLHFKMGLFKWFLQPDLYGHTEHSKGFVF